ncbi:kinase phosphorylation protein-domain-containing protein [Lipomyces chichibuensis]|uniref:kinase phosphorylation protein-domain-containing protein n=1 Tax=Lipomyces chichibuensis TaxID=1546026 RepID=UPI0033432217
MDLLSNRPTREGIRGGQGSFSWDTVKQDKYRQNYLGHSVMAPTGRWAEKNDALWYSKEKNSTDVEKELDKEGLGEEELRLTKEELRRIELRRIKEAEEIAMAEALGTKPRVKNADQKESSTEQSRSRSTSPEPRSRRSARELERYRHRDDRSPRPQRSHYHSRDDNRTASYDRRRDDYRSRDDNGTHHSTDGREGRYRHGPHNSQGRHYYSRDHQPEDDERPYRRQRDRSRESTRRGSKDHHHNRRESRDKDEVDKFLDGLGKPGDDGFIHHSRRNLIRE